MRAAPSSSELTVGEVLPGGFKVTAKLGASEPNVFEARHPDTGQQLAAHWLSGDVVEDVGDIAVMLEHLTAASRLRHPNIARVHRVGTHRDGIFVLREMLTGESLAQRLARSRLELGELATLYVPVVRATAAAHSARVFHGNLTPAHVFLCSNAAGGVWGPKVLGFGSGQLARLTVPSVTRSHRVVDPPHFVAPEQVRDDAAFGAPTDIYALGAVLYHALAGVPPFGGATSREVVEQILGGTPAPLAERRPDLPEALCAVIHKAMARSIDDRHESAQALARALVDATKAAPAARGPASVAPRAPTPSVPRSGAPSLAPPSLAAATPPARAASVPPPAAKALRTKPAHPSGAFPVDPAVRRQRRADNADGADNADTADAPQDAERAAPTRPPPRRAPTAEVPTAPKETAPEPGPLEGAPAKPASSDHQVTAVSAKPVAATPAEGDAAVDGASLLEEVEERPGILGKQLGRYEVLVELASGGMASVFAARVLGVAGFERLVAVKLLHPNIAHQTEFIEMFLDEARLAARIRHPNVVPTLDISDSPGDGFFLVMEYIEGTHLGELTAAAAAKGERLPPRIAAKVLIDALDGLGAAHALTDERGEPLGIVHRDVSPANVMVGTDGIARLTDFGVAKAEVRLSTTRSGQLKGKLAYMSPEHASTGNADQRSDLFSMGIVLWEALTGDRLFRASNHAATLNKVLSGPIPPPSSVAAELAPFDAIVAKALDRDPDQRFQTAEAFITEIERVARAYEGIATTREVAKYAQGLVHGRLSQQRARIERAIATLGHNEIRSTTYSASVSGALPAIVDEPRVASVRPTAEARVGTRRGLVKQAVVLLGITLLVAALTWMVARQAPERADGNSADAPPQESGAPALDPAGQAPAQTIAAPEVPSSPLPATPAAPALGELAADTPVDELVPDAPTTELDPDAPTTELDPLLASPTDGVGDEEAPTEEPTDDPANEASPDSADSAAASGGETGSSSGTAQRPRSRSTAGQEGRRRRPSLSWMDF